MGTVKDSEKTRARLIEAGGRLFAEKGFKGVTVRDIAAKAQTHLSALNYHFKTKDALYREVLLAACRSDAISAEDREYLLKMDPGKALVLMAGESLKMYAGQGAGNWQAVVLNRECRDPGPVFHEVARTYFMPETDFVARIIGNATGKSGDDHQVRFAVLVMIGLLETFGLYSHLVDAVAPEMAVHFSRKDRMAKEIVRLVLEAAAPPGKEQ